LIGSHSPPLVALSDPFTMDPTPGSPADRDTPVASSSGSDSHSVAASSSSASSIDAFLHDLSSDFTLKILVHLVGIEVVKSADGIVLTQNKYTLDILARAGTKNCKTMNTLLHSDEKLSVTGGEVLSRLMLQAFAAFWGPYNT
jgi:hypothetical protein